MRRVLAAALLGCVAPAVPAETTAGLQLYAESAAAREEGVFTLPADRRPFALKTAVSEFYVRHAQRGMVFEWALAQEAAEGHEPSGQGRLNELYSDFSAYDLDFTAGKKVMSSGIGFGFRPLDVIQREDRRALFDARLEGVPLLALESIDADSALSFIYFNRLDVDQSGAKRAAHEGVVRHYRLWGELETHALVYLHERYGAAPGGGFTRVSGESLEWHGALLYQPRFARLVHGPTVLSVDDPWIEEEGRDDGKALIGLTWTHETGYSLLLEAWHDNEAMSRAEWEALSEVAAAQRGLLGTAPEAAVYGSLAWDLRAFQRPSLLQDNLLWRLSYDGERTDPYLDVLITPEDGGYVATLGVAYEIRQGVRVQGGARGFDGPADSAYGQSPVRAVAFLTISGEMAR